ncbi:MAG: hypothetical protein N2439_07755 [Anaerolineae bacterium]|nr:hypothetical protein [Anaerolineae bacterium]
MNAVAREAVEGAMAERGHVPGRAARVMRPQKSVIVGPITGAISTKNQPAHQQGLPDPFIVQGVQRAPAIGRHDADVRRYRGPHGPGSRVIAETLYPPLTTVELAYTAMGVRAAERLIALIGGGGRQDCGPVLVSGPVHWRGSVTERARPNVVKFTTLGEERRK